MKDRLFLVFRQVGEFSTRNDVRVSYIIGTDFDAQRECNRLNKAGTYYYYYMDAEEVKEGGREI